MSQSFQRHCTTHHVHRSFADESGRKHYGMNATLLYSFCYSKAVRQLKSALKAVVHICLYHNSHIIACRLHHFGKYKTHKTHAILERTAEFIFSMISIWRKELRDKVTMACMYLNAVESGFTTHIYGSSEILYKVHYLMLFEGTNNSW